MTLTHTQKILGVCASGVVVLAFVFGGLLWAAEKHFQTIEADKVIMAEAVVGFEKAIKNEAKREVKREIRRLKYKQQKGTITDQELFELEGLYQELEELQ